MHLQAYMIVQTLRFLQHIAQEPAGLPIFDWVEYRSAIPGSEGTVEELAILAEPIIAINTGHWFTKPNKSNDMVWCGLSKHLMSCFSSIAETALDEFRTT